MPTTRKPTVIIDAPPETLVGDEAPTGAMAVPVGVPVDMADPRTAALHGLLQPPVIIESDHNTPSALPLGLARPIPVSTGIRYPWFPDGDWFLVCSDRYPRELDADELVTRDGRVINVGKAVGWAAIGDEVQLRDDPLTAQHLVLQYIVPA